MNWLKARLSEPSTHAGIGLAIYALAKAFLPQYGVIIDVIAGALGVTAAVVPDSSNSSKG